MAVQMSTCDTIVSRQVTAALSPDRVEVGPKFRRLLNFFLCQPWRDTDPIIEMVRVESSGLLYSRQEGAEWKLECLGDDLERNMTGLSIVCGLGSVEHQWLLTRVRAVRVVSALLAIVLGLAIASIARAGLGFQHFSIFDITHSALIL